MKNLYAIISLSLVSVLSICLLFIQADKGIDLSDESYCLIVISNPNDFLSFSFYGHLLHPVYNAVHGNISLFRQVNFTIFIALSSVLFSLLFFFRNSSNIQGRLGRALHCAVALALGSSVLAGLTFMGKWYPTPSYTSLTFQAGILVLLGCYLSVDARTPFKNVGLFIISLGLWLLTAVKISSAAAITVFAAFFLFFTSGFTCTFIVCCVIPMACWVLYIGVNGWSVVRLYENILESYRLLRVLAEGTPIGNIVRFDDLNSSYVMLGAAFAMGILLACSAYSKPGKNGRLRWISFVAKILIPYALSVAAVAAIIWALLLTYGFVSTPQVVLAFATTQLDWLFFLAFFLGLFAVALYEALARKIFKVDLCIPLLCVAFSMAIAFGSGVNLWLQSATVCLFWVFGGAVLLNRYKDSRLLVAYAHIVQFVVLVLVIKSTLSPFMQTTPLYKMKFPITVERTSSRLFVSEDWYNYLTQLKQIAFESGFVPGAKIISLTGYAPGALYVIGGSIPGGAPWMFGHPQYNRYQYAKDILQRIPPDILGQTWLLAEFDSTFSLPVDLLEHVGRLLSRDYQVVGQVISPGMGYAGGRPQYLFKPK